MCAQEPIDSSQKVDSDEAGEELFKLSFNFEVFREINKVIVGEDALTKGVLAVALLEGAALFDGETDQ